MSRDDDRDEAEREADEGSLASAEVRRQAALALSERPPADAVAQVLGALSDPDWRVRKEAAASAARLAARGGDAEPTITRALADALLQPDDVGLRNAAIEAFAQIGERGAPALVDALERAPATARKFVCAALGGAGAGGVPALAELSRDPDPNTATVALESLARTGGAAAEEALRAQLDARDWVVRLAALEGLAALGARVPVARLAPMIADPLVRRFALRLLGRSGDPAAVPVLLATLPGATGVAEIAEIALALAALGEEVRGPGAHGAEGQDGRAAERHAAEVALASGAPAIGAAERAALRALVSDDDVIVGRAAASLVLWARDVDALGVVAALAARAELGKPALAALAAFGADAVRPLLSIAPGLDPPARAWALEAAAELATLGGGSGRVDPELGREVHAALRAALESRDEVVAHAAARGLSFWAEPGDAAALVQLGATRSGAVARAAGTALEALAHSAPQSVEIALDSAPPDRADAWSGAVSALPEGVALEKLRAAIASGEPAARRSAVLALDRVDGAEAAEVASMALADEDVDVQVAAVTVLARLRDPAAQRAAASTLRVALRDERAAVRAAAVRALGTIGDPAARSDVLELLRDAGPGVALAAMVALRALGGAERASETDVEELLVDVLGHPDEEVVKEGLRTVAESTLARKEARLAIGLAHAAWDVRRLAASLIGAIGSAEARARLEERARVETDDLVRSAIADALAGAARPAGGSER